MTTKSDIVQIILYHFLIKMHSFQTFGTSAFFSDIWN